MNRVPVRPNIIDHIKQRAEKKVSDAASSPSFDMDTRDNYRISCPKCRGRDALPGGATPFEVDDDIAL